MALLALGALATDAPGQATPRPGRPGFFGDDIPPSVFRPFGLSGGGPWVPPPDAGPSDGSGPGGGPPGPGADADDGAGPTRRGTSRRGESRRVTGATLGNTTRVSASASRAGAATLAASTDRWDLWWETNKFDFIELRRIADAPRTGQGIQRETPGERELRLAHTRRNIREQVLPVLRELTSSPDAAVRASSIVSLAKLGDPTAVDLADGLLRDPNRKVRRAAMLALGVMDAGRAAWCLMNIADDTRAGRALLDQDTIQVDDRGTALVSVSLRGGHSAEPVVRSLLANRSELHPEMIAMAADAAGLMGSQRSLRSLLEIAFDAHLPEYVRSSATTALGRIGEPSVVPALVELLDGELEPKRAATIALGSIAHASSTRVIQRLVRMLRRETDAPARHLAAISLGRIGGEIARQALEEAFERPAPDMRPWLALGLALCERANSQGQLAKLLIRRMQRESNADTVSAYAIALGLTSAQEGVEVLADLARHGASQAVAAQATLALGLSGQGAAAPVLREIIANQSSPFVLRQAALGLGILSDAPSIPVLLDLIRTTNNPSVASFAAIGIALMGDAKAAGPLLHLIEREGPAGVTTTWAVAAVGQLFDQDRRPALSRLAAGDNYLSRASAVDHLLQLGF